MKYILELQKTNTYFKIDDKYTCVFFLLQ